MKLSDTIIRQRGTTVAGPYGSGDELDWTTPTTAVYQAEVYGPTSQEDVQLMQRVEAQYITQTYSTADIDERDRVVWQGDTYEIVSGVDKLPMHGVVLSLKFLIKRVTGG